MANELLDTPGWKHLKSIAKNDKKFQRMIKQQVLASRRHGPIYMFGVRVPRSHKEAMELDKKNGNNKWREAEIREIEEVQSLDSFIDKGKGYKPSDPYKKIKLKMVYAVKHDLRHKARLCARGDMTEPDKEQAYSGVVQLKSLRIALLIGELNGLKLCAGDISNAYLTSYTSEKVYVIAGPEFGELEGHTLIISKALYGLQTSGARYRESFSDVLRSMGWNPTLADPDVWYKVAQDGSCYEYVCVYVDDLMAIMMDPENFYKELEEQFKYKLKGVGQPEYHLGGNFGRDPDGTLVWGSKRYIEHLLDAYKRMFGKNPHKKECPLPVDDQAELDESEFLSSDGIKCYQSLIGGLQWAVTLGRFDILEGVMSLSRFRVQPCQGHMERVKHIFGYLRKYDDAAIHF